jgi:hypothetical protein
VQRMRGWKRRYVDGGNDAGPQSLSELYPGAPRRLRIAATAGEDNGFPGRDEQSGRRAKNAPP